MPKYWALGAALAASFGCSSAWAQTIPKEYNKVIAHHSETGTLTDGLAGDRIDLSTGGLEIVQTDIDLPGNNALPVRVGRRFVPYDVNEGGNFRYWNLDLPSVHGTFDDIVGDGWKAETVGGYNDNRCSSFGKPPDFFIFRDTEWDADDYWHGTFFYSPGSGDQELLQFWAGAHAPSDGHSYYAMTRSGAAARCVPLATTSDSHVHGEGFEMVTQDGVVYTLNQMVRRYRLSLLKGEGSLPRADYFLFPTQVADRFGNTVTYTWSDTNPWQLLHIVASDGRHLDFTYEDDDSIQIASITDGSRTWRYAYSPTNGVNDTADTLTLPDGGVWSFRLARLHYMQASVSSAYCAAINGVTQRTTYDDGGGGTYAGSITGPSGATTTFAVAQVLLGRSHVVYECVSEDGDPTHARPVDPYLFAAAAVVHKTITGPGLPAAGLNWSYSYGPSNNCWEGTYSQGIACTPSSPNKRMVLVTDPMGVVTRYTFGNWANVDEGMLYQTDYAWDGAHAQRRVKIEYGLAGAAPYGTYDGWSPRGNGDPALTSRNQPQRKVTTTQQGRDFTWEVAADCSGMPYCFDEYARPTKVVKGSQPAEDNP